MDVKVQLRLQKIDQNHNGNGTIYCKKFVTGVRRQAVKAGSVAIQHDFTEALQIEHQKEVQSMHFGGNVSVSI